MQLRDRGSNLCGIVTATIDGLEPPTVVQALRERGINTSATDFASAVLDFTDKGIGGALRVSPHYYNTSDEVEALASALEELVIA